MKVVRANLFLQSLLQCNLISLFLRCKHKVVAEKTSNKITENAIIMDDFQLILIDQIVYSFPLVNLIPLLRMNL